MMKSTSLRYSIEILLLVTRILFLSDAIPGPDQGQPQKDPSLLASTINSLQIPFIANHGQGVEDVRFYARTFSGNFFVTRDGEMIYAQRSEKSEVGREKVNCDGLVKNPAE